jgi:hypothetical protein
MRSCGRSDGTSSGFKEPGHSCFASAHPPGKLAHERNVTSIVLWPGTTVQELLRFAVPSRREVKERRMHNCDAQGFRVRTARSKV